MDIGTLVKVKPPFDEAFPIVYTIMEIVHNEGEEAPVYILEDAGGFDEMYLIKVD